MRKPSVDFGSIDFDASEFPRIQPAVLAVFDQIEAIRTNLKDVPLPAPKYKEEVSNDVVVEMEKLLREFWDLTRHSIDAYRVRENRDYVIKGNEVWVQVTGWHRLNGEFRRKVLNKATMHYPSLRKALLESEDYLRQIQEFESPFGNRVTHAFKIQALESNRLHRIRGVS